MLNSYSVGFPACLPLIWLLLLCSSFFIFCCVLIALFITVGFNPEGESYSHTHRHTQSTDPIVFHMIFYSVSVFN